MALGAEADGMDDEDDENKETVVEDCLPPFCMAKYEHLYLNEDWTLNLIYSEMCLKLAIMQSVCNDAVKLYCTDFKDGTFIILAHVYF